MGMQITTMLTMLVFMQLIQEYVPVWSGWKPPLLTAFATAGFIILTTTLCFTRSFLTMIYIWVISTYLRLKIQVKKKLIWENIQFVSLLASSKWQWSAQYNAVFLQVFFLGLKNSKFCYPTFLETPTSWNTETNCRRKNICNEPGQKIRDRIRSNRIYNKYRGFERLLEIRC